MRLPRSREVSRIRAAIIAIPLLIKKILRRAAGNKSHVHDNGSPVAIRITKRTANAGRATNISEITTDNGKKHLGKRNALTRPMLRIIERDPDVKIPEIITNVKMPLVRKAT